PYTTLFRSVVRARWKATRALVPVESMFDMEASAAGGHAGKLRQRTAQGGPVADGGDLVGVGRIGGVTGALQALGKGAHVAFGLQRLRIARTLLQQPDVVGEALGGRGIGTEFGALGAAHAVAVFVGVHAGAFAAPAGGLDAEQVVGAGAVAALDQA